MTELCSAKIYDLTGNPRAEELSAIPCPDALCEGGTMEYARTTYFPTFDQDEFECDSCECTGSVRAPKSVVNP